MNREPTSNAHQNIALLLEQTDGKDAIEHHRLSVEFGASTSFKAAAMTNLALAMFRMIPNKSRVTAQSSISILLDAIVLAPENSNIPFSLGLVYAGIGDHERANVHFRETLETDCNHSMALMNIGNYYFRRHDFPQASVYYERAIEAAGDDSPVEKVTRQDHTQH